MNKERNKLLQANMFGTNFNINWSILRKPTHTPMFPKGAISVYRKSTITADKSTVLMAHNWEK